MPSHLHPRSSATTTLFASTLAASFIIVGIPHVFPCPAPRKGCLDAEGNIVRRRRRRRKADREKEDADAGIKGSERLAAGKDDVGLGGELKSLLGDVVVGTSSQDGLSRERVNKGEGRLQRDEEEEFRVRFQEMKEEAALREREGRECPVPKPRGRIGELLGFGRDGQRGRAEDDR